MVVICYASNVLESEVVEEDKKCFPVYHHTRNEMHSVKM